MKIYRIILELFRKILKIKSFQKLFQKILIKFEKLRAIFRKILKVITENFENYFIKC